MKFCSYCGKELQDDAVFCTACNSNLSPISTNPENNNYVPVSEQHNYYQNPEQTQQPYPQNPYQQPYPQYQQYPQYQVAPIYQAIPPMDNIVVDKLRKLANSPLLIILASLLSLNLLLSIIPFLMNFDESTVILAPLGLALPILIVIGIWITFSGRNSIGDRKTGGITLIQTSVIITFVLYCICMVIMAICMIIMLFASSISSGYSSYGYESQDPTGILFFIFFFCVLFMALPFIYYIFLIKTISSIKKAVGFGIKQTKGIMGTVVFNFIIAFSSLIGGIISFIISSSIGFILDDILNEIYYSLPYDVADTFATIIYSSFSPSTFLLNGFASFLNIGILVTSSILLLKFKKEMEQ